MAKEEVKDTTSVQKTEEHKVALTAQQVFENQLGNYRGNIKSLLAAHGMSEAEFMVTAINAIKKTPELINVDRKTLFGAIMMSAELGLPPNTPMQLSFIIPYGKEASFQLGYMGWIEIMQRNPKVESMDSGNIYSNEEWTFDKGLRMPFSHKQLPPSKRGEYIGSYAIAWIKDSEKPKVVFLYKEEIEEFKKISQASKSKYSPWTDTEKDPQKWMYRKTCIKQLAKELPKTREIHKAIQQDNAVEMGGTQIINEQGYAEVVENEDQIAQKNIEKKESKDEAVNKNIAGMFGQNKDTGGAPASK